MTGGASTLLLVLAAVALAVFVIMLWKSGR
jgi:hypothetical protein